MSESAPSPTAPPHAAPSNLQLRLATAAVGLPLLVVIIWIGGWPFALVAAAIALLAAAEFMHGWLMPSMPLSAIWSQAPGFAAAAIMVGGAHWDGGFVVAGVAFAVFFAILGYSRILRGSPRRPYRVLSWCLIYIGLLFSTVVLVRDADHGRAWVFLGILATFATDTGAYTVGRLIGRHKLAPKISPKKTREGAVGGWVAGTAAVFALNALFDTDVSAATIAPLAILLPLAAQAGDLFESWMKRRMGVKDASGLLPGHGGFMDRLDSVLFVMPTVYVFLRLAT
ncbi:MAG TPA: phosphatidate cytidylyltransferase [Tepidiformaceae bacterium]|nr:phosphatidate cytidylyltransferase [Tepidiformaceae bacterium]